MVPLDKLDLHDALPLPGLALRGGHELLLLEGGRHLFPSMVQAMDEAQHEIWLATYILDLQAQALQVIEALERAAQRGVKVRVLVDGFGSASRLSSLRARWRQQGVALEVFRPLERWTAWFQPSQLRRMHQKIAVVDGLVAFVGGINLLDDHLEVQGWSHPEPRLDFAVRVRGPLVKEVEHLAQALWTRAHMGRDWREELALIVASEEPLQAAWQLARDLRTGQLQGLRERKQRFWRWWRGGRAEAPSPSGAMMQEEPPIWAALIVRDNVTQRRVIERAYVEALSRAQTQVEIACSYFYPGRAFRRALVQAARRGVRVRLLLQGRPDYVLAGLAARVLYAELLAHGIEIHEYMPAHLHAKVAVVDDTWATVGSSNIDPLSLLLNLEANVVVWDPGFARQLRARLAHAFSQSQAISGQTVPRGARRWLSGGLVAGLARLYMRLAGVRVRY